jgi:hypothetical protein
MGISEELENWLRKESADRERTAHSRRGYARAGLNCTDVGRVRAHALAEQMLGRRIPKTTMAQDDESAKIQERIALKLDREAAMLLRFAEYQANVRAWINDLQSGMYVNCIYCGHRYGPNSEVAASMADVLKQHIETCPEHPMSALKAKVAEQAATIERMNNPVNP